MSGSSIKTIIRLRARFVFETYCHPDVKKYHILTVSHIIMYRPYTLTQIDSIVCLCSNGKNKQYADKLFVAMGLNRTDDNLRDLQI